jgi:hypothetical protein
MFKGLFDNQSAKEIDQQERDFLFQQKRNELHARAEQFDLQALDEAHQHDQLYRDILDIFINHAATSQENLEALVSHISKSKALRTNRRLAEHMIEIFKNSPNKKAALQLLHLAALSDDAAVYEKSIELAVDFWKKGLLPQLAAKELLTLIESEYWLLSSAAKRSGTGFVLKERLAELRRELK